MKKKSTNAPNGAKRVTGQVSRGGRGGKSKSQKYQIRALGYCIEVTAHKLRDDEVDLVNQWCEREGFTPSRIEGNLEEALGGYNCYSTNLWQSGIVPVIDSVRLVLVDKDENEISTISKLRPLIKKTSGGNSLTAESKDGNVLVYFEEYKGLVATWTLESKCVPAAKDFTIDTDKIVAGGEEIEFIDVVRFQGKELERDYEEEDIRGKAAYSLLL